MSINLSLDETLRDAMAPLFEKGLLSEVLCVLKSGKEATVYACRSGSRLGGRTVAVKVYRPLTHRHFRDDSAYTDGRVILSGRVRRAVSNGSAFGREAAAGMWHHHEVAYLRELHAAGVRVPRLLDVEGPALVLEFIGDASGTDPAPQLRELRLPETDARRCWHDVASTVATLLRLNRVHGDLSPYNLLYHEGRPWVIDLPQMVDPRQNPNARTMLERDLENVWRHLRKSADLPDPWKLATSLWLRWRDGTL